ncbi:hypothetical protein TNCV_1135671 [Trichonephila clavipes]|nr:hypothetical protein TNCV_1135671 [Trichonephila clavipes]
MKKYSTILSSTAVHNYESIANARTVLLIMSHITSTGFMFQVAKSFAVTVQNVLQTNCEEISPGELSFWTRKGPVKVTICLRSPQGDHQQLNECRNADPEIEH